MRVAFQVLLQLAASWLAGWAFAADPVSATPPVDTTPGPEYADDTRMFQGIPAIERSPNGRLWAAWYGGGVTEDRHNHILLSTSGDEGKTWQRALVIDPDRDGPVRAFDPCLWHDPDGRLWLFWAQRPDGRPADCFAITTTDSGNAAAAWSAPRRVFEGIMMNKPLVATDGRWLFPAAVWGIDGSTRVVASSDHGGTFAQVGTATVPEKKDRNCDEPMCVQRKDGALWMLVRTGYGIGESLSTDGGKTWPEVTASAIPHPVSRFFIRRLASGRLLLVRHNPPDAGKARSHLTAFLSEDDGLTWKGGLLLDERRNVSYPDGVESADGLLHVIYDFERTRDKEILMAVFREDDVLQGKPTSPDTRLRVRVNQATGKNPGSVSGPATAALVSNTDGEPLLDGPAPKLEFGEGEPDTFVAGAPLFLDRKYVVREVPAALRGRKFIRSNITGGRVVCRQPGVVYLLTPSAGRQRDSLAEWLMPRGFAKARVPECQLFDGEQNISSVFQKRLAKDEVLEFGKWAVLVLPGDAPEPQRVSSVELAANTGLLTLWDPQAPFPGWDQMPDLEVVTHVQVERAERGGFHYLHESAIEWHKGILYAGWANHPLAEVNVKDELLRGRTSADGGLTWSAATTWAASPLLGGESVNHPVIISHQGKLWGFFTRWEKEKPGTEIFAFDESAGKWQPLDARIPGFLPFTPPRKMRDGNWILGGELHWFEAAVAISTGDDFTRWQIVRIPRPAGIVLQFPETTLLDRGDELIAICRPKDSLTAPASTSADCGRTWAPLSLSNFPLAASKPLCGTLSTGQHFLITGNLEQGRALMSIAVSAPGARTFSRIWKVRHQQTPKRRYFGGWGQGPMGGTNTEWSYPAAVEHDGRLYISYTQGKEDCALSIVPLSALRVNFLNRTEGGWR